MKKQHYFKVTNQMHRNLNVSTSPNTLSWQFATGLFNVLLNLWLNLINSCDLMFLYNLLTPIDS